MLSGFTSKENTSPTLINLLGFVIVTLFTVHSSFSFGVTFTSTVFWSSSAAIVTFAVPSFTPVKIPSLSTVTIVGSLDVKVNFLSLYSFISS